MAHISELEQLKDNVLLFEELIPEDLQHDFGFAVDALVKGWKAESENRAMAFLKSSNLGRSIKQHRLPEANSQ